MSGTVTLPAASIRAAVVHVNKTHPEGTHLRRQQLDGKWPLHQRRAENVAAYLDPLQALLPVAYRTIGGIRKLVVIDARRITGYTITAKNRVIFETAPAPELSNLINTPAPAQWLPGHGWPVKIVDLSVQAIEPAVLAPTAA